MTGHPIRRLVQSSAGFRCAVCDQPVHWVMARVIGTGTLWHEGHWEHVDPELEASIRRHPAGRGRLP